MKMSFLITPNLLNVKLSKHAMYEVRLCDISSSSYYINGVVEFVINKRVYRTIYMIYYIMYSYFLHVIHTYIVLKLSIIILNIEYLLIMLLYV